MDDQRHNDDTGPASPPPPPPPTGAPHARRIRRDTRGGMLGGVAAGFARHLDIDVVWVRLGFVVATVFGGGLGIVVYLASWLIIPDDDDHSPSRTHAVGAVGPAGGADGDDGRGATFWTGVGLVSIGGIVLLDRLLSPITQRIGWIDPSDIVFPLVLIGIGALVYRSSRVDRGTITWADEAEGLAERIERDAEDIVHTVEDRIEAWGEDIERRAESWDARQKARAQALRTARSQTRVAPVTFGVALLVLGGMWLLSSLGVAGMSVPRSLASALLVIGVGLIVGAFLGRGRGLIVAGLLLAPVVAIATLAAQLPGGLEVASVGRDGVVLADEHQAITPMNLADLSAEYEFGAGGRVVDLRGIALEEFAAAGTVTIGIEMGIGELEVLLPEGVAADVQVELGIGRIELPGSTSRGIGLTDRQRLPASGGADGLIRLVITQGIGNVTVTR